jgi:putative membrane protein
MFTTATAPHARDVPLRARPLVGPLLAAYAAVWAWCAVRPLDRAEWALEQLLPAGWLLFLALAWRKRLLRLSDASCAALAVFLALHAVGARYGYEATPAGAWLAERLGGAARNPYDRVVHLAFGVLLGYVGRELWLHFGAFPRFARAWASAHALSGVLAASALYEVLEWGAALLFAPGLGSAFVGAQGDVWDAPADMAMAGAGAAAGLALVELAHRVRARARARAGARRAADAPALPAPAGVYQPVDAARRHATRIRTPATG